MSEYLNSATISSVLGQIEYKPNFRFHADVTASGASISLVIAFDRPDTRTGIMGTGTIRYTLPRDTTESGLVQFVFGKLLDIEEHECREAFKFLGERVFGPHNDLMELWKAAQRSRIARGERQ